MGHAGCYVLRRRAPASRPGNLGFAGHGLAVVAVGFASSGIGPRLPSFCFLIVIVVAIGIPAATLEARGCGRKDPSHVVIDEVAGQLVTLIACPIVWQALLAGFILFRVFDILKPPPVRSLEKLPEGTGIVVDDLGAGVYGLIVLQLLLHFGVLRLGEHMRRMDGTERRAQRT